MPYNQIFFMKKVLITIISFVASVSASAQLFQLNNNGAKIVMTDGSYLVLNDMAIANSGTFDQTAGTVKFAGSSKRSIYGPGTYQFYNLEIAKSVGEEVQLVGSINILNQILFSSGYLNLNSNNVFLSANASLNGEHETSRTVDYSIDSAGYVELTKAINAPASVNVGNLGAILSSSQDLGLTTFRRGHRSQRNSLNRGRSIFRYFDILPANNNNLNATLRFTYFNAELNYLDEQSLELFSSTDALTWVKQAYNAKDINGNYVEKSSIPSFSRWTLSNCATSLDPLALITYFADADGDGYGNASISLQACTKPQGYVTNQTDCDDNDSDIHPGGIEICSNNDDDNCNGTVNENCSSLPGIFINDLSVFETQGLAVLTVSLSEASIQPVVIKYATVNGTASSPSDYKRTSGELSIPAGALSATISIPISQDNKVEPNEYFDVKLLRVINAILVDDLGRVTIIDGPPLLVQKTIQIKEPFQAEVYPNPTAGHFTIRVQTRNYQPVEIKIFDALGRLRKQVRGLSDHYVVRENELKRGIYMLEIRQGTNKSMLKLVKL